MFYVLRPLLSVPGKGLFVMFFAMLLAVVGCGQEAEEVERENSARVLPAASVESVDGERMLVVEGRRFALEAPDFRGSLFPVTIRDGEVQISGWSVYRPDLSAVNQVLMFGDGDRELLAVVEPQTSHSGIAELFGVDSVNPSGFEIRLPRDVLAEVGAPIHFYALYESEDKLVAGRINYPEDRRCMLEILPEDPAECAGAE